MQHLDVRFTADLSFVAAGRQNRWADAGAASSPKAYAERM